MSNKRGRKRGRKLLIDYFPPERRKEFSSETHRVPMHPIPARLVGQRICAMDICLNEATQTACDDPAHCTDEFCAGLIACDEHADTLAGLMWSVLNTRPRVETVPPEGEFGGHD